MSQKAKKIEIPVKMFVTEHVIIWTLKLAIFETFAKNSVYLV
jgi:hypothetical protein